MKKNLTNYGDTGFSIFLRKAFIKGLGYSDDMLDKKIQHIIEKSTLNSSIKIEKNIYLLEFGQLEIQYEYYTN